MSRMRRNTPFPGPKKAASPMKMSFASRFRINLRLPPRFAVGFCWGGAAAWVASARCTGLKAVSCFYGRIIADLLTETPKAPPMFHYGARDPGIPLENVERVRAAAPDWPLHLYDAGHGFCREGGADYDKTARDLALTRTMDWFARWRI